MRIFSSFVLPALVAFSFLADSTCWAQLTSPQIGWQTELSTLAHGVSGLVTILDEDSIQVENFTYDGGGISVFFYLGTDASQAAFIAGTPIGPQLKGTSFDGTQGPLVYDLPAGNTLEGLYAISVWCVAVSSSFGTGTFTAVPEPSGVVLASLMFSVMLMRRNKPKHCFVAANKAIDD